jgi:hypothetical protein
VGSAQEKPTSVSAREQIQARKLRRVAMSPVPERNVCPNDIDDLLDLTYDPDSQVRNVL